MGESIAFEGSGSDPEDGTLSGSALAWQSSLDGSFGTGASLTTSNLSAGNHTITLTATDADGATGTDVITIEVEQITVPGGSIVLLPEDWRIPTGQTIRFRVLRGEDAPSGDVVWSVNGTEGGNSFLGTIGADGVYTAPSSVPQSNPVDIRAQIAGSAVFDTAPVEVVAGLGPVGIQWEEWLPRVVSPGRQGSATLEVVVSGYPTSVELELETGGVRELMPVRSSTYSIEFSFDELVVGYTLGDLHSFVGFLRVFDGGSSTGRFNIFVNVSDGTVAPVSPDRIAEDVQAADHVVNVRHDDLILGGALPEEAIRRFYDFFPDDFDFIAVVEQVNSHHNRSYRGVRNDVRGIGASLFDRSSRFGSSGRLQGTIDYPISGLFDLAEKAAVHEIGHRWMAFISEPHLDNGTAHWPLSSTARGIMGFSVPPGFQGLNFSYDVVHVGGAVYELRCSAPAVVFNDLELYLMGFIPSDSVGPQVVFDDQQMQRACGATGTATVVTVEDVVAADGPRVPDHAAAQRDFRIGTVVLSSGRLLTAQEMAFFEHMAARGEARQELHFTSGFATGITRPFFLATGGRATLSTRVRP